MVRVDFQKKVRWVGFTLAEAVEFRKMLDEHIDSLLGERFGSRKEARDGFRA